MILNWNNTFAVGNNNIDEQHKELFYRLNKLLEAMKEGKGKGEVITTLDFLEEYVVKHFTDEEEIQRKNNYPKLNIQHKQHEEFKNDLKELRRTFESTGISSLFVINTQQKMVKWCKDHIMSSDKELGNFLMKKTK
ncbi:bacteriohemerythrin [Clostridium chromiireducens]|uniref:Bacteriohemerythrin n=1 Tax=Clostridium chromiireducens TaxID=225345 RepID=A0A964RSU3_9CLOT|nr:hemerythrin family protein [Clostridium chromiireducens]MVX67211.1 bacteriohemerythrin [Clostridium chromiireducens]